MPTLRAPLLSIRAHGRLGHDLYYADGKTGHVARHLVPHADKKSLAQNYHRFHYGRYCIQWSSLSQADKDLWKPLAQQKRITPFNAFISYNLQHLPDLALHYRMDEGAGITVSDTSKNNNIGTLTGPLWIPGVISNALRFNTAPARIDCPVSPSLNAIQSFTIEFYFRITTLGPLTQTIIRKFTHGVSGFWLYANTFLDRFSLRIYQGATYIDYTSFVPIPSDTWIRQAVVYNRDAQAIGWVRNGVLEGLALSVIQMTPDSSPLYCGDYYTPANDYDQDDLLLFNKPLSTTELGFHFNFLNQFYPL